MKVHLLRSEGFEMEEYNHVFNILNQYSGGITFVPSEPIVLPETDDEITFEDENDFRFKTFYSIEEPAGRKQYMPDFPLVRKTYSWKDFFEVCLKYRRIKNIPESEPVILLTDEKNELNWFGGVDESLNNYFIETCDWGYYFPGFDNRFPIAYSIAGWMMRKVIFANRAEMENAVHEEESIGCLMDLCEDKKEITLKMRTADICEKCMSYSEKNDSNRVYMNQLIQIMDGVRSNLMFRDRSKYLKLYSRLEFRAMLHNIFLTDLGDYHVRLNPKERALYVLFMNHPEGIARRDLIYFKGELKTYYEFFYRRPDPSEIDPNIERMVHPRSNNFMEILSRIRGKFKQAVGEEQYKTYSIESVDGVFKIQLDRELVSFNHNAQRLNEN